MLNVGSSVSDVIEYLRDSGTQKQTERVVSRGVDLEHILGTPKMFVQESAKSLGRNHKLAVELWDSGFHESRLVAILIADPTEMSARLSRDWTNSIWSWDLCDHFSRYLLPYITDPDGLIGYCASQAGVYVRRTAFAGTKIT